MNLAKRLTLRLGSLLPRNLRAALKDSIEAYYYLRPSQKMIGIPELGLSTTQLYPEGRYFQSHMELQTKNLLKGLNINRRTPVASIGSCFAEEFARYMLANGYNYLRLEKDKLQSSANWGRVFTITSLQQVVQYSLGSLPNYTFESSKGWLDPLREAWPPLFQSEAEAVMDIEAHRAASRRVFLEAEVLTITLGQNENWMDHQLKIAWARRPPSDALRAQPSRFSVIEATYEENRHLLRESMDLLLKSNPNLKLVFTVSPVPSAATFSSDNVVTQSFANKCMLRALVHELLKEYKDRVFYFPSFEIVLCQNPKAFRSDHRHVKSKTVQRIFRNFEAGILDGERP